MTQLGYRVIEAEDAPSGLAALEANLDVMLLFTDVGLPGMNGRDLAIGSVAPPPDLACSTRRLYAEGEYSQRHARPRCNCSPSHSAWRHWRPRFVKRSQPSDEVAYPSAPSEPVCPIGREGKLRLPAGCQRGNETTGYRPQGQTEMLMAEGIEHRTATR